MESRRPKILEINYLYMVVAILLLSGSLLVSSIPKFKTIYPQIIITQYAFILLPMIIYMVIKKYNFKEVLRLNKLNFKQVLLSIVIPLVAYPIGLFFNYITLIIISYFGELQPSPLPIPETINMFIVSILLFAITPGICEEIMFRGVIFNAYERIGAKKAIILTGLLFGLFHFDVQNLLGPAFLGMLFAYMVYTTNSIYTSMIAHAVNNSIAVVLLKIAGSVEGVSEELNNPDLAVIPETQSLLIAFVFITMIAVTASVLIYFLLKALSKSSENSIQRAEVQREKITSIHLIPIIAVVMLYIVLAVIYFYTLNKI